MKIISLVLRIFVLFGDLGRRIMGNTEKKCKIVILQQALWFPKQSDIGILHIKWHFRPCPQVFLSCLLHYNPVPRNTQPAGSFLGQTTPVSPSENRCQIQHWKGSWRPPHHHSEKKRFFRTSQKKQRGFFWGGGELRTKMRELRTKIRGWRSIWRFGQGGLNLRTDIKFGL